jgi:hypothetical protein
MQSALEHMVAKLIAPHRTVFSTFKPLGHVSRLAEPCYGRDVEVVA